MRRSERERLHDIVAAAEKCRKYSARLDGPDDELVFDGISRNLEIIGEAAKHLTEELRQRHPSIPWSEVVGFRNLLAHEYFRVDRRALDEVIEVDLPRLLEAVRLELA